MATSGLRHSLDDTNPMEDGHHDDEPSYRPRPDIKDHQARESQTQLRQRKRNFNINLKLAGADAHKSQRNGKQQGKQDVVGKKAGGSRMGTLLGKEWASQRPSLGPEQELGKEPSMERQLEMAAVPKSSARVAEPGTATERNAKNEQMTERHGGDGMDRSSHSGESGGATEQSTRRGTMKFEKFRDPDMTEYREINELRRTMRNFNESRMVT